MIARELDFVNDEMRTVCIFFFCCFVNKLSESNALKKLARENFAHLSPSKINVVLEYSHPPLHARIDAVEKAKKQ